MLTKMIESQLLIALHLHYKQYIQLIIIIIITIEVNHSELVLIYHKILTLKILKIVNRAQNWPAVH
jgi:hypothetical protein